MSGVARLINSSLTASNRIDSVIPTLSKNYSKVANTIKKISLKNPPKGVQAK